MASRPRGFGMSAAASRKLGEKYDPNQEEEAKAWIEAVLGANVFQGAEGPDAVQQILKDGKILANLAIKLGATKMKVNEQKMPFKQMENISNFLTYCGELGVQAVDQFQTADLYDNQNMTSVISCIHALGRKCQTVGLNCPALGPKEASANVREFTDEQLRAGEGMLSMQSGPTMDQIASAEGEHFGRGRQITDQHY